MVRRVVYVVLGLLGVVVLGLAVAVIAVGFNVLRPAPDSAALANQLVASSSVIVPDSPRRILALLRITVVVSLG